MLAQGDAIGLCTIGLSARIDCVRVDCWPKVMPLGYGLEGLSVRIDCVRGDCWLKVMHWVMYYWAFSPY